MKFKRIFGLVGFPVRHSLSPVMHNAAFKHLKLKYTYKLFEVTAQELGRFLSQIQRRNIAGLNITVPYKEEVLKYIKGYIAPAAREIGAVNTLVVSRTGGLKAYNTDYLGFMRHLKELKIKPGKAAVLGAGGAAKAVCFALGSMGSKQVTIYDIDKFKALGLMKKMNRIFPDCQFLPAAHNYDLKLEGCDLLVNATPLGMKNEDPLPVDPAHLHKNLFVYDLIYNPLQTKLLFAAEVKGCGFANGLDMLLYQGVEALNRWISPKKAPLELMRKALYKGAALL